MNFRSFGTRLMVSQIGTEKMVSAGRRVALAAGLGLLTLSVCAVSATAQSVHRSRRESNANRKARIARTVEDTYTHKWEAGAGGGFLRFRTGEFKQQINEVTFWGSALYSLTPKLGVVGMAGGAFGSARLNNTAVNAVNPQIQNFDFMAGPSYRFVSKERYSVSVYGAGGVGYGRFSTGPKDFPPNVVGLWNSSTVAAFGAGVNLDYNFYPNLAVRVTPNYLGTTYSGADGGSIQNSKGVNFGIIYRFGRLR